MKDRTILLIIAALLGLNLAWGVGSAFVAPPDVRMIRALASEIGARDAIIILLRAQIAEMQRQGPKEQGPGGK